MKRHRLPASGTCASMIALCALLSMTPLLLRVSQAQSGGPASAAGLKPELEPLSFFLGQWNCEGEFPASHKPIASHIGVSATLDNSWIAFQWDDKAPNAFHALELWGFDKAGKHFTNFIHDSFGGARLFTSPGWGSDRLVWTGGALANPPGSDQRFVIERKAPSEFVITWQVRQPQTDWATGDRLTCRK